MREIKMEWLPKDLDPVQRDIIKQIGQNKNKTYWVEGFAGSGKTVVLVKYIAEYLTLNPEKSVCFVTFTHALCDLVNSGLTDTQLASIRVKTYPKFVFESNRYKDKSDWPNDGYFDLVLVDEIQDIPKEDINTIRRHARHLVVAGDTDQRIYDKSVDESDIIESAMVKARTKLIKIFRITKKIAAIAKIIFPSTRIQEAHVENRGLKKGSDPFLWNFPNKQAEVKQVWEEASALARVGGPAAILLPSHKNIQEFAEILSDNLQLGEKPHSEIIQVYNRPTRSYEKFNFFWKERKINLQYLGNRYGSFALSDEKPMVYLLTYHSSKGLDFPIVFLPFLDDSLEIAWNKLRENIPDIDERLFYVASTRSKGDLYFSYSGNNPHEILSRIIDSGLLTITKMNEGSNEFEEDDIPF